MGKELQSQGTAAAGGGAGLSRLRVTRGSGRGQPHGFLGNATSLPLLLRKVSRKPLLNIKKKLTV